MKVLVIALILFTLVIVGVTVNAFFVYDTIEQTQALAAAAFRSSNSNDTLDELWDFWNSRSDLLGLSVSLREIDSATENLLVFQTACKERNQYSIKQSYALFCDSLDDILRYEKFSIGNLF